MVPALTRESWFLTGPTASGKSAVGVELAERINAEIVSMDSMTLYRGMDIGTAKPTVPQRCSVPHHLIDVIEPHEEYSLAQYVAAAGRCAAEIAGRGRQVLFVGGTPLYLKGLLRGIFQGPPADWELRRQLADSARLHGSQWLHQMLAEIDRSRPPDCTRTTSGGSSGRSRSIKDRPSDQRVPTAVRRGPAAAECRAFVLDWPKAELHVRIERRVHEMFAAGLIDEVRGLLEGPRSMSKTAQQAVGYREVIEHLAGHWNLAETVELVERHSRQLAKRQSTWFRSLSECRSVPVSDGLGPVEVAERILEEYRPTGN